QQVDEDRGDNHDGQHRVPADAGAPARILIYAVEKVDESDEGGEKGKAPRPRPHPQEARPGDAEDNPEDEIQQAVQNQRGARKRRSRKQEREADEEARDSDANQDNGASDDEASEDRNAYWTCHVLPPSGKGRRGRVSFPAW